ncbi:MAG: lipid-A-disaccharide synthase [Ignavibacteriales bacterium]|nr:MAG: lipid-A-disaccharide synthase [Ignavibacteriales bacterium]
MSEKKLMIIAGEISGDLHGASLVEELKKINSSIQISGIGGDRMKNAGMKLLYHIHDMAFLGFVEVIKHLPFIKKVQRGLINFVKENNIRNVVLIDYPGFNLSIAKKLKALNVNVIYYISPQVWAWGAGRIKKIKKLVDKMLVVFPFEEDMYKREKMNVEFVGHPLIERINAYNFLSKEDLYEKLNLEKGKEILLLLPGSRQNEVKEIFSETISAAIKLAEDFNLQVVVACSENISEELLYSLTDKRAFKIAKGFTYDLMKHAKFGIIKSGTSTLEAGIMSLPMIIVYKTSMITYLIGKSLVKLKHIGMANIILSDSVVPELIQDKVKSEIIYAETSKILLDESRYSNIKNRLGRIKEKLGGEGASGKAALSIMKFVNEF